MSGGKAAAFSTLFLSCLLVGGEVLCDVIAPIERETIAVPVGLDDWQLAWRDSMIGSHVLEWVPGDETIETSNQLFTVQRLIVKSNITTSKFVMSFMESLSHTCPGLRSSMITEEDDNLLLEWQVANCRNAEDQYEMDRFIRTEDYLFRVGYTRKNLPMTAGSREYWLDVLRQVYLVRCCDADDQGLSAIPLLQLLASSKFNEVSGLRFELSRSTDPESPGSVVLASSGFPSDHIWQVQMIRVQTAKAYPFAILVADEQGVLRCPQSGHEAADMNKGEYTYCNSPESTWPAEWNISIQDYPRGLPVAFTARSMDGTHATYTKIVPFPIINNHGTCQVELELVSNDARTFVAYGSGFPPGEVADLAWTYARHSGTNSALVDSSGTFMAALNHPGQASGRRKWDARLDVSTSSCKVTVPYKWGDGGMEPQ